MSALQPNFVYCANSGARSYADGPAGIFPELPSWARATPALASVRALLVQAGLDGSRLGSREWNPFRPLINKGSRVVIKPNWVHHENLSGHGIDCLVTHSSVIEAILHYVAKADPGRVVVGDAPLQGCDFTALMSACRVPEIAERFRANGLDVSIKDFRRTVQPTGRLGSQSHEGSCSIDEFIQFDLGPDSALEEITAADSEFRVTMYNPDLLKRTHGPGRHQYLIARDVIEADVVINVPKLKTHKKACITGALKNLVGINGHKEYLPHHRKGGSGAGGDCYPGRSRFKGFVEDLLDATNRAQGVLARRMLADAARAGMAVSGRLGTNNNYEGSWHGNDTVWRMCLDLQRVLHYGRTDGTLASDVQRTVLTITDAVIAGQGDGPLAPTPIDLGVMTLGTSTAALDWVHAMLMGIDPRRVPLVREAFVSHRYPLTRFSPDDVVAAVDGHPADPDEVFVKYGRAFRLPTGWRGQAELGQTQRVPEQRAEVRSSL